MLQIRITSFDGSNPIILENAKNRQLSETVSSSDEGITFDIAKNDPKAYIVNPDLNASYVNFWEVWDTVTNARLNYGPIDTITENGPDWKVTGSGRSSLLANFYKTKTTFYAPISSIVDDLRFENVAAEPRSSTLVHDTKVTAAQTTVFGAVNIVEKYSGLSKQTKDNAIDDQEGLIQVGQTEPNKSYFTTDSFWAGMGRADTHVIDLGGTYNLSKIGMTLPWWGGTQRLSNRAFDFEVAYANDTEGPLSTILGRDIGPFHTLWDSGTNNKLQSLPGAPIYLYMGTTISGTSVDVPSYYTALNQAGPVSARYIRTKINNTHAWFGTHFDDDPSTDGWDYQCDPTYNPGDNPNLSSALVGAMHGKTMNDRQLEPSNDCFASIVEVGAFQEILPRDTIKPLALQRIDNNNMQITYSHSPAASETITTTTGGFRKFEPGSLFRQFAVTWSNANTNYTKFFSDDCTNCYPDGFHFAVVDQNNTMVYATDSASGSGTKKAGAFTKHLMMKGDVNAVVTYCDAWPAQTDVLSWGGSYSYTTTINDTATLHFRGQSLRWFATVPQGSTAAVVKLEIRHKDSTGAWTAFTTLDAGLTLPTNISAQIVYEITYESGTLVADTIYEFKITNLNGGYCAIDSFEGYWSASLTQYNEDSLRIPVSRPWEFTQIYDSRFSGGSMYKWNKVNWAIMRFEGDRIVVMSAKGRNHGKLKLILMNEDLGTYYDPGVSNHVFIPGGNIDDGSLTVDLSTGKRGSEITQYVAFDSNDYFTAGLPWGRYIIAMVLLDLEPYTTTQGELDSDSFVARCVECTPPGGTSQTVNKFIYLDAIAVHERIGLSVAFNNETHLDILKSVAEACQVEWAVTEAGIRLEPRIGVDTDEVLREGQDTLVNFGIVHDISKVASMLVSSGSDIDGLPLFTITEDKSTRALFGRTIMRQADFRNIADYFTLVGLSRSELKRRQEPEKRITVTHVGNLNLNRGDSFTLLTKKKGPMRVRIMRKQINESSGRTYDLECIRWPQIV